MPGSRWQERTASDLIWTGGDNPLNVPPLVQRLLKQRGFESPETWQDLFEPKLSQLKNPLSLKSMDLAVERLVLARERQESVCLYADFDMDGTSGLALALDGFRDLGFENVIPVQPARLKDGYGFHDFIVEDLHQKGVNLIVTIDVGITALKACHVAKKLGVDVIVTDHHQPGPELPEALAIVNPNQGNCPSGLGYLCGAGVIFTVLRALKRSLADRGLVPETALNLKSLLDLFTVATLTDMVPLVDDNRLLVKHGLKVIENSPRPGIQALLKKLNLHGKELTAQDVAIRFAPKLNALSRLETGLKPLDLYLAKDLAHAEDLVEQVLSHNSDRLDLQGRGDQVAQEMLKSWPHADFVLLTSTEFHRGVVGLIATKIANDTGRPTFIGAEDEDGVVVGSARTPQGSAISVLKALASGEKFLQRFGGHNPAAGFEFLIDHKNDLIEALRIHHQSLDFSEEAIVEFDATLKLADLTTGFLRWMDAMGPFGVSFPVPVFQFHDLVVDAVMPLRGGHQKWVVRDRAGENKMDALYFSPPPGTVVNKGAVISILGEVQKNTYQRTTRPQILIRDFKIATSSPSTFDRSGRSLSRDFETKDSSKMESGPA